MSRIFLGVAVLLSVSGCYQPPSEQTLVYEAMFNRMPSFDRPINVLAESVRPRGPEEIIAGLAEYRFQSTDFIHEVDDFGTGDVKLIAEAEYSEMFSSEAIYNSEATFSSEASCGPSWAEFTDQYGDGGLVRLSGVGFNADSSRAVVYMEYAIDCFRGGSLMRYEKNESWQYTEEERVWVLSPPEI